MAAGGRGDARVTPTVPRCRPAACRPPAPPPRGAAARGGTGLSGALKDVTSNIDDCRLFVRAVPYAAGSPRGYLAVYLFKFFNLPRSHRVGSVLGFPLVGLTVPRRSVARCLRPDPPAAIPPPTAPRTDQGQRPERRAQHSAQRRAGGRYASELCGAGPAAHHATSSRNVITPVPAPPMPHPARPLPSAPLVTMPQGRQHHCRHGMPNRTRCFLLGYVTLSRRRRNPHRSSRELLPERQVQST